MKHVILMIFAVALGVGAAGAQQPPKPQSHEQHADTAKTEQGMMAKCQAMMAEHDKMMADMKAADQRLDALVAKMNAASGQQKTDATAAVVSEIVAQRKTMHASMMKMHDGMMKHTMEHMQAGTESMAMCPMMKGMK